MITNTFFWSWATWAKLSFALGCAISLVLTTAALVKLRNTIKLRQHARYEATDLEAPRVADVLRSTEEIPFGLKAMQEGTEIRDVWNSRNAIPLHSPLLGVHNISPYRSPVRKVFDNRGNTPPSILLNREIFYSFDFDALDIKTKNRRAANSVTSNCDDERGSTPNIYKVLNNRQHPRALHRSRMIIIGGMDGSKEIREAISNTDIAKLLVASNNCRRKPDMLTNPLSPGQLAKPQSRTMIIGGPSPGHSTIIRTSSYYESLQALNSMEAHRQNHAAESGQLHRKRPRYGRASLSGTYQDSEGGGKKAMTDHKRAASWPIASGEVLVELNAFQKVKTEVTPEVVSFRASFESQSPLRAPPSAWTSRTQEKIEEVLSPRVDVKLSTSTITSETSSFHSLYDDKCSSLTDPVSDEPSLLKDTTDHKMHKPRENSRNSLTRSNSKNSGYISKALCRLSIGARPPKKLQKRNRSSFGSSRISIDNYQVYTTPRQSTL